MRTTLNLDDALVQRAKRRALELNLTLGEFLNRALREALRDTPAPADPPFSMVTYGPPEARVHHEPGDFYEAMERDDLAGRTR